ncbi:hypothetical protein B5M42_016125 [Paenibacillus athensensis]|uniref:RNA ligase domain-containing protein n=1 Tax=Paenibacillus athensensis TaxID=1967502 RepID=A0A4Y8Q900_9BACL|nr:RNA ligase family protein [Paenibacillus athensensis]MCD1260340.1 hypothetical protein [Paenibacillus athensensis]
MRKLASMQKITAINDIENSDALAVVTVLGWKVVVRRADNYHVGDLVIYFELDSILPDLPEFNFLAKSNYILKSARLRGQLSQGLVWKPDILPDGLKLAEGMDVTGILGVRKHEEEIPIEMVGKSKGFHPKIIRKAGEVRLQSSPELLAKFQGLLVAETTKIEGESASYIQHEDKLDVCSHTHSLLESPDSIHWQMYHKYNFSTIFSIHKNIGIQAEIAGPGIFGNPLELKETELFVFRITDTVTQRRFTPVEIIEFCQSHGLQHVPMTLNVRFDFTMEEAIERAKGEYLSGNPREGIVIVPMEPTYSEVLCDWLSVKVINNEYLDGAWKKNRNRRSP